MYLEKLLSMCIEGVLLPICDNSLLALDWCYSLLRLLDSVLLPFLFSIGLA